MWSRWRAGRWPWLGGRTGGGREGTGAAGEGKEGGTQQGETAFLKLVRRFREKHGVPVVWMDTFEDV
jgi:hypothetical protein